MTPPMLLITNEVDLCQILFSVNSMWVAYKTVLQQCYTWKRKIMLSKNVTDIQPLKSMNGDNSVPNTPIIYSNKPIIAGAERV